MFDRLWEAFISILISVFLPVICIYHSICQNPFLNVSVADASGFEKIGNVLLVPFQYIFAGKTATQREDGS